MKWKAFALPPVLLVVAILSYCLAETLKKPKPLTPLPFQERFAYTNTIQSCANTTGPTATDTLPPGYTLLTNLLGQWGCKKPDGETVKHTWNYRQSSYGKVYSYEEAFDARTTAVYYAWETYSNDLQTARERAARAEIERKQNTWFITERGVPQ